MGHNQGIPLAEQCPEREVVKSSLVQWTELGKKGNQVNTAHKQYALTCTSDNGKPLRIYVYREMSVHV